MTPGPWTVYADDHPNAKNPKLFIRAEGYGDLCEIGGGEYLTRLANAATMAAAPVLLAACQRLVVAAEDFASSDPDMPSHKGTETIFDEALINARAAIASAQGFTTQSPAATAADLGE